nr:free fatty acid receptor 4 [Pogona vitticeps]
MPEPWASPDGNFTLFPFFSDFKGPNGAALSALETAVLASLFALALAANGSAIRLMVRRKGRLRAANSLVLNLFCADLLFVSAVPVIAVVRWTESWTLGDGLCHLLFYLMSLSGSVTILSLAAVSLERLVSIVRLRPSQSYKRRRVGALLLLIWAFSALTTLPFCLFFTVQVVSLRGQEVYICTLIWPSTIGEACWDACFVFVVFLIPGVVIVISYSKILQIAKASRKRLDAGMAYSERSHVRISQQDFKLLRTLFILMVSFFVMWSPIIITILLILVQKFKTDVNIMPSFFFWIMVFTFSNSVLNPVLYNAAHFKHEWRKIFICCPGPVGKKEPATDTTLGHHNHGHFTVSVISH